MKQYILLKQDEDGNPVHFIEDGYFKNGKLDIKEVMDCYEIKRFKTDITEESNPQYWDDDEGMLIEYEIKVPKAVKIIEKYEI